MSDTTPRHPRGTITTYTDVTGRTQTAVTGPNAHVLITRKTDREPFQVWHAGSLATLARTSDRARALEIACNAAGIEL